MNHSSALCAVVVLALLTLISTAVADEPASAPSTWSLPKFTLPSPASHPAIAATPVELKRLRAAWNANSPEHEILAARFANAAAAIAAGIDFPPEGGQHNQWYQCTKCQVPLVTIDAHHHQCPICKTIYSGFPYDNVLYARTHAANVRHCADAAWAYAATGDRKYSDFVARMLTGYAERYLDYPMVSNAVSDKSIDVAAGKLTKYKSAGHMAEQTLDEAMYLIPFCVSYDLIYNSGSLTDAQKAQIESKLIRAMADCIGVNRAGKSNWQTWHNAARFYAGAVLGDQAMADQALSDPKNGFVFQMNHCVLPNGMWFENSWGYHYYTLTALTHTAEGARRLNLDLYSNPNLEKMYLVAFDYRMPDGSLPRFGDAVNDTPDRPSVNEAAYAAYHDQRLLASLPAKPSFDSILLGRDASQVPPSADPGQSTIFPGAGHAILRTDGPAKITATFTFGPFGGFHSHFDKLSFVLFAYGHELGVDPGRAASQAYRLPIHQDWYRSTTGHNAVLVDGKSQEAASGKLLAYAANSSYALVAADAGPAFKNVDHKRLLVLTPTYLLAVDHLTATDGKDHTYDLLYHNIGKTVECKLPEGHESLGDNAGYAYLQDVKNFTPDAQPARLTIPGEKVDTHLILLTQPGDTLFTANGPLKSITDRATISILRRRGKDVTFVTVIEPTENGQPSTIKALDQTFVDAKAGSRTLISISQPNVADTLTIADSFGEALRLTTALRAGGESKELLQFTKGEPVK